MFPIFQKVGTSAFYFYNLIGKTDAETACMAARKHGVPRNTIIYFAVDFDATDPEITNSIIPYFSGVNATMSGYRVGIYATRNVCNRVAAAGLSVSSFVSDMSTGFSGNLGFKMPLDWAYDQIKEYTNISYNGETFDLDKNIYSGRDSGFNSLAPYADSSEEYVLAPPVEPKFLDYGPPLGIFVGKIAINLSDQSIPVWDASDCGNQAGSIIGYVQPGDAYSRLENMRPTGSPPAFYHVTFHDSQHGLKQGYYLGNIYSNQGVYHEYNSDGAGLVSVSHQLINGDDYLIFVTKKILDRRNASGILKEKLPIGTKLAVINASNESQAGMTYPNYMKFRYYSMDGGNTWLGVGDDVAYGDHGFVDLGLHFGAGANTRAIW